MCHDGASHTERNNSISHKNKREDSNNRKNTNSTAPVQMAFISTSPDMKSRVSECQHSQISGGRRGGVTHFGSRKLKPSGFGEVSFPVTRVSRPTQDEPTQQIIQSRVSCKLLLVGGDSHNRPQPQRLSPPAGFRRLLVACKRMHICISAPPGVSK